jgi:hypothetical protein
VSGHLRDVDLKQATAKLGSVCLQETQHHCVELVLARFGSSSLSSDLSSGTAGSGVLHHCKSRLIALAMRDGGVSTAATDPPRS